MQVRSMNQSTSEIRSSFDYYKVKSINNLSAALDSSTLKKMNTEALSAYLQIHLLSDYSLNSKAEMNDRVTKIIRVLQKIIEKFTL